MRSQVIDRLSSHSGGRLMSVYALELLTIVCAAIGAYLLRFDFTVPPLWVPSLLIGMAVWVPVKLLSFKAYQLDRRWARYIGLPDLIRLGLSNITGSAISAIVLVLVEAGTPRSIYVLDLLLCAAITAIARVSVRVVAESGRVRPPSRAGKRALIYGAGDAGTTLLRDLRQNPSLRYDILGFIDDNPRKSGLVLHGVNILGGGQDLRDLVEKHHIEFVLIAIPSASGDQLKNILERCNQAGIPYKTIPSLVEIIETADLARQIRDVAVEDLLGRSPVSLEQDRIAAKISGRVVLITGAAGSIGSEICRQAARFSPAGIVAFEIAESPLFSLQLEMNRNFPHVPFHAEIGSIQNPRRLHDVFSAWQPSVVYHAAAYKHVPLMEAHICEAVENNVFGTLNVVEAARAHNIADFVMISSDKAVRPANVMGATKRIAELLVRSLQPHGSRYVSVRFGNVLGSNGSVVPIFKEQIARGGPVTVTDPEMRRYFMTIPEACQLVLQASTMGNGGEIFVLDMGEPVRIVDLARNLILLSGLNPGTDIEIEFTGARAGEKLYEELNMDHEDMLRTHHEKIRVFSGEVSSWATIDSRLRELKAHAAQRQIAGVLDSLTLLVPDYEMSRKVTLAAQ